MTANKNIDQYPILENIGQYPIPQYQYRSNPRVHVSILNIVDIVLTKNVRHFTKLNSINALWNGYERVGF